MENLTSSNFRHKFRHFSDRVRGVFQHSGGVIFLKKKLAISRV